MEGDGIGDELYFELFLSYFILLSSPREEQPEF